jgi:phosphoenolpyruvate synthase/pyruvate phosphate dikinase
MDLQTAQPWVELPAAAVPDSDFGLKACNLVRLSRLSDRLGFEVPAGFLVPPSVLDDAWAALGLSPVAAAERYASIVQHGDVAAAGAWRQRVEAMDLPPSAARRLQQHYRALSEHCGAPAVVVRSSFYAEDSSERSCAGLFTSVRNVSGAEALCRAVRGVYASLFAARTVRYLSAARRPLAPRMAVIVQRMIGGPGWVGGVAHSRAPDLATHDLLLIAASPELDGVTSGATCPEEYLVHRPNLRRGLPAIVHTTAGTATAATGFAFDQSSIRPLAALLMDLEHAFGHPLEIEWARAPDGRLFILQARPLPALADPGTALARPSQYPPLLSGLAVGHGEFTGTVRRVEAVEEGAHLGPQDVLVTRRTDADWDSALARVGAVITGSGGRTSHTARLARERRSLAVVGCGAQIDRLRDGERITLVCHDGLDGVVYPANGVGLPSPASTRRRTRCLRLSHPFAAFSMARAYAPAAVEVDLDQLRRAIRVPRAWLLTDHAVPSDLAARIAGEPDVRSFVRARFRDALAIVCTAFPHAEVRAIAPSPLDAPADSFDPFQPLLEAAVRELADGFGFQVASAPRT